jgi:hypothetical protein
VFLVGAVFWKPVEFQMPQLADTLRNVGHRPRLWLWIHVWIAAGVVLTTAGLVVWTEGQRAAGELVATPVGLLLYQVGALLWLVALAMRVTVQPWAAAEVLATGQVPAVYPSLHRLAGALYAAHMALSYLSASALGLGILRSGVLSARAGWTGVIAGAVCAIGFVALGGGPFAMPVLAHAYTCALGVMILRAR